MPGLGTRRGRLKCLPTPWKSANFFICNPFGFAFSPCHGKIQGTRCWEEQIELQFSLFCLRIFIASCQGIERIKECEEGPGALQLGTWEEAWVCCPLVISLCRSHELRDLISLCMNGSGWNSLWIPVQIWFSRALNLAAVLSVLAEELVTEIFKEASSTGGNSHFHISSPGSLTTGPRDVPGTISESHGGVDWAGVRLLLPPHSLTKETFLSLQWNYI